MSELDCCGSDRLTAFTKGEPPCLEDCGIRCWVASEPLGGSAPQPLAKGMLTPIECKGLSSRYTPDHIGLRYTCGWGELEFLL